MQVVGITFPDEPMPTVRQTNGAAEAGAASVPANTPLMPAVKASAAMNFFITSPPR